MRRRDFITLLSGSAAAWPLAARAQQPSKLPTIGYLGTSTMVAERQRIAAFLQRLRELGWIEGRNLAIEFRWAEGSNERFAEFSGEFVRLNVGVIVASGAGALAAKQATSVIPIVFPVAPDPIGAGLVTSLARPMGNVTGLSSMNADLAGKRLELLREMVPGLRQVGILVNVGYPWEKSRQLRLRAPTVESAVLGLSCTGI